MSSKHPPLTMCSLNAQLQDLKHLDDYELYKKELAKNQSTHKFILIMHSIRRSQKQSSNKPSSNKIINDNDISKSTNDDVDNDTTDLDEETATIETYDVTKILRRHRKRFKSYNRFTSRRHH